MSCGLFQEGAGPQVSVAKPECVSFRQLAGEHDIKFIADVTVQGASGHSCHGCAVVSVESVCTLSQPVGVIVIGDLKI
jgi:hypothetical protein